MASSTRTEISYNVLFEAYVPKIASSTRTEISYIVLFEAYVKTQEE
jgi:hypothetical protein